MKTCNSRNIYFVRLIMFQIVCRHMIRYVNLQPTVILSLKIKSRAKKKKNKQTTTTEKKEYSLSVVEGAKVC